jgi:Beta-lactamase enzyme family
MPRRISLLAAAAAVCAFAPAGAGASPRTTPAISTHVSPRVLERRHSATIAGRVRGATGPAAGQLLELQAADGPGGRFRDIAHTLTDTRGSYRFAHVRTNRDLRYRVIDKSAGGRSGPTVELLVQLPPYPPLARVLAAARYLAGRAGECAFAVVDSHGRVLGSQQDRRFVSASVVKSMMLVAYLQMLARQHRPLDSASQALLYPMIHSSDNAAASAVLAIVGQAALDRLAREAGMRDYQRASGWWAFTQVSAADLARFFFAQDKLIPGRFDAYARQLLSTIEASQSWGAPAVARPEFQVYFKGGWLPEEGVVNQAARLESRRITFAMAVLITGDPSMSYGEQTIEGLTARLLGRAS